MTETASPSTQTRHTRFARKLLIDLAVMTIIGVVLALIGPFGSFAYPLPSRLVAWLAFSYVGYAIYSPMGHVVERLHHSLDLPRPGLWVAACLVATVPMAVLVWLANAIWYPEPLSPPTLGLALTHYAYVFVIGGGVTLLFNALSLTRENHREVAPHTPAGSAQPTEPVTMSPTPFLDRLPPQLGSDLLALEMEDHYVRAHTALGSDLVLMRMRDAVGELDGMVGVQVHRSWWVARHAVEDVRREGRNVRLILPGGVEAPVSRSMVPVLKDEGWF